MCAASRQEGVMTESHREPIAQSKLHWYRVPIDRALLAELNRRSDAWGFAQTLGHLGIIMATGALAWFVAAQQAWWWLVPCLFLHGTVYAFLLNGFHELCHNTVFKTRALNRWFLYLFSFLGGLNHVYFWASHQEHHKYTLHQPDDMEVVLPVSITLGSLLKTAFINPVGVVERSRSWITLSRGVFENEWQRILFAEGKRESPAALFGWARVLLVGHGLIIAQAFVTGWWMLPVLCTFAPFYGGLLLFLCNNTQHVGLRDEVEDFRLCTRTIYLNPVVQFLYWHMNFHIEHHMYAGVPCYRLARLHRAIRHELPPTPGGLVATWREIIRILRRQQREPAYQFTPEVPARAPELRPLAE
jgi:fatty acid desaturase